MRSIAIIPARSGSKGLPDKNIRPLNGKPLLAYSIEAAPPQRRDLLRYRFLRGRHPGGAAPLRGNGAAL